MKLLRTVREGMREEGKREREREEKA